jgi:hypothetical protein
MTARTRHGSKAHRTTHGADRGSTHERLHRMHAQPNRPEGAPMSAAQGPSAPPPMGMPMAPQPQDNVGMAPPGAPMGGMSSPMDTEEGDQT